MYYFPLMSITPTYFDRNRGAAMGIVLAGAGVGGLVMAPVFHSLLTNVGIQWALRILGIWNFVLSIPVSSVLPKKRGAAAGAIGQARVNMALVKRGTFILQVRNSPRALTPENVAPSLSGCRVSDKWTRRSAGLTRRSRTVIWGVPAGRREHGADVLPHHVFDLDPLVLERDGQSFVGRQYRGE